MIEENYNYSYNVTQINVENGTFEVEYLPESLDLTPIKMNLYLMPKYFREIVDANNELVYASQEEVPFELHLENTIDSYKPMNQWRNQYMMVKNIDKLQDSNGSFTVDTTKNLVVYPSGFIVKILPAIDQVPTEPPVSP